jgi:hypothetical protein
MPMRERISLNPFAEFYLKRVENTSSTQKQGEPVMTHSLT